MSQTWGIVTMTNLPTPLLLCFVASHLQAGASEIHMCMDVANPEFEAMVADKPQIRIWNLDESFWVAHNGGHRSPDLFERQLVVARVVFGHAGCDWLLHIDTDEYLIRVPALVKFLSDQPPAVTAVKIFNAERVYLRGARERHVLGGLFRKPFRKDEVDRVNAIYGEDAGFLYRGFSGYAFGKCCFRVGADVTPGVHRPVPRDGELDNSGVAHFPRVALLHFDTFTRNQWLRKMAEKVNKGMLVGKFNPGRKRQIEAAIASQDDPKKLGAIHDATRALTLGQFVKLVLARKLLAVRLRPDAALRAHWPNIKVDLSPAGIDAAQQLK